METANDKAKRIIAEMVALAIDNGEPNFSINVGGDKSTIESGQGHLISSTANIESVSLFINLDDTEEDG